MPTRNPADRLLIPQGTTSLAVRGHVVEVLNTEVNHSGANLIFLVLTFKGKMVSTLFRNCRDLILILVWNWCRHQINFNSIKVVRIFRELINQGYISYGEWQFRATILTVEYQFVPLKLLMT